MVSIMTLGVLAVKSSNNFPRGHIRFMAQRI